MTTLSSIQFARARDAAARERLASMNADELDAWEGDQMSNYTHENELKNMMREAPRLSPHRWSWNAPVIG